MTNPTILKPACRFLLTGALILSLFAPHAPVTAAAGPGSTADFIITVATYNDDGTSSTQFFIPAMNGYNYNYNYNVDCNNDGTNDATGVGGSYICNYASPGIYTIRISDNSGLGTGFPRIYFDDDIDSAKLLTMAQ